MADENFRPESNIIPIDTQNLPAITPMRMLEIAVEKGADLDQLQKLMDLQERWEASEARRAYITALTKFKANPPTIVKNKTVSFGGGRGTSYDHATLDQVVCLIAPALAKHGLTHGWSMDQADGGISVTCTLTHELGHSDSVKLAAPADSSGSKNAIQAIASTVSYLQRYTLLGITGLSTAEQDDDGIAASEMISADQKKTLVSLMEEVGADTGKFLRYFGVEYIDSLPAARFDAAKKALEEKRKKA
jgi:hypothetical protein